MCHGVSASAFIVYFQKCDKTCQRSVSKLVDWLLSCHVLSKIPLSYQTQSVHAWSLDCITMPTSYQGCWNHLTWQMFTERIVQSLWKNSFKVEKNMLPLVSISFWCRFVVMACCIRNSRNTKKYQHLGQVGIVQKYDKWRMQQIDMTLLLMVMSFQIIVSCWWNLPLPNIFLGMATGPITKLDSSFAINQEAFR